MNGDATNLYARCRVDRVSIELGGAVVLCLEPTAQAKSDQFVFDRPLMIRVPQIADKAVKDAAAEFIGRYFDVRISLVGELLPGAKPDPTEYKRAPFVGDATDRAELPDDPPKE